MVLLRGKSRLYARLSMSTEQWNDFLKKERKEETETKRKRQNKKKLRESIRTLKKKAVILEHMVMINRGIALTLELKRRRLLRALFR